MRILVACQDCKRRYDASKREIGSRFRCLCGELLTVRPPRGHESTVVRCSSCGSPREQGINKCTFCNADFTIHERDLHTVCPECLARVSDQARHCAHCGVLLSAEMVAGEITEAKCPCCRDGVQLADRQLSESRVSVLECPHCGGFWLGISSFKILRDRIARQPSHLDFSGAVTPRLPASQRSTKVRYRKCIVCSHLMHRRQYGRGSGVIIDVCRSHGIWFDDGELQQVIEWIRRGGRTDRPIEPEPRKKQASDSPSSMRPSAPGDSPFRAASPRTPRDFLDNVFDGVLNQLGNLFD